MLEILTTTLLIFIIGVIVITIIGIFAVCWILFRDSTKGDFGGSDEFDGD